MTYYKATRPDGTDFRTGTIDYAAALAAGEVVLHPSGENRKGDPATYLSVATVPTDCTGFAWPCRLFTVEAVGDALPAPGLPNKRRVAALRVTAELPAHEVFGPQGEAVVALIDRAARLSPDEVERLAAASYTAWDWDTARDTARDAAIHAARDAAIHAARAAGVTAAGAAAAAAAVYAAAAVARDAAVALVVRDLITPDHFNILYGPWASVIDEVKA